MSDKDKQLKRRQRQRLSRLGMMQALPYLTFPVIFTNIFGNWLHVALSIAALMGFSYALFQWRLALKKEAASGFSDRDMAEHHQSGLAKIRGTLALGAGMAAFAYMGDKNLLNVLALSALAMGAAIFALGLPQLPLGQLNPRPDRQQTPHSPTKGPLEVALDQAQVKLTDMAGLGATLADTQLRAQVFGVYDAGRAVVEELQRDPADLPRARRFLVTYLDGALKIIQAYVAQSDRHVSASVREKFSDTLVTLETTFIAQLKKLRDDDDLNLDIQMDVLDTQMKAEGVL